MKGHLKNYKLLSGMELSLRKTKIQNLNFVISSCPSDSGEDVNIAYSFIKEMFCRVCKQSLLFSSSKYDIIEYPFLFRERQLDSVVLPVMSSLCKGLVIAEYPIVRDSSIKGFQKDNSKGRIDYWCIYKDYSLVIEMKHSYDAFRTDKTNDERLIKRWETMTISQLQDVRKNVKYFSENTKGVIRIGLHFITPYSSRDNDMNDVTFFESSQKDILKRLARDVSRHKPKTTIPNFLASWVLPDENKYFEVSYKGTYPGLLLLGKIYSSIAHEGCVKVND